LYFIQVLTLISLMLFLYNIIASAAVLPTIAISLFTKTTSRLCNVNFRRRTPTFWVWRGYGPFGHVQSLIGSFYQLRLVKEERYPNIRGKRFSSSSNRLSSNRKIEYLGFAQFQLVLNISNIWYSVLLKGGCLRALFI